jgi:Co/Zn/Cd efflux system component
MLAALGVFYTGTGWPDLTVAAVMGTLALHSACLIIRQAVGERSQVAMGTSGVK